MKKYIVYGVACLVLGSLLFAIEITSALFSVISGIVIGLAIALLDAAIEHSRHLRLAYYALRYRNQHIRISISYLFRIKMEDGVYLLVKSTRYGHFQPVGGVYKSHASVKDLFDRMGVRDDDFLPIDDASRSDLRVRVPGKHLVRFIRWFESGQNREIGGWREFQEELISTGLLPRAEFVSVEYDFVGRTFRPLRYSQYAQSKEIFIADIFDLLPTLEQRDALRALRAAGDQRVHWAGEEQIVRHGGVQGRGVQVQIGEHAKWIIG